LTEYLVALEALRRRAPRNGLLPEQGVLPRRHHEAEMTVRGGGRDAAARRALQKSLLDQIRLVDLLERAGVFAHGHGERAEADGTALEFLDDRLERAVSRSTRPAARTAA